MPQTRDQGPGVAPRWLSALGQVWASGLCLLICPVALEMPVSHRAEDLAILGLVLLGWPLPEDSGGSLRAHLGWVRRSLHSEAARCPGPGCQSQIQCGAYLLNMAALLHGLTGLALFPGLLLAFWHLLLNPSPSLLIWLSLMRAWNSEHRKGISNSE